MTPRAPGRLGAAALVAAAACLPASGLAGQASAASLGTDALRFRPDPRVSQEVRRAAAAEVTGAPARAAALRLQIAGGALYEQYRQFATRLGADPFDAGDAMGLYLTTLWVRANAPGRDPTAAELAGGRAQARASLATNPGGRVLTDEAGRQRLAERMAYRTVLGQLAVADARRAADPAAALARVRDDAVAEGRRFLGGLDLQTRPLGPTGFGAPGRAVAAGGESLGGEGTPAGAPPDDRPPPCGAARGADATAPAGEIAHVVLEFNNVPGVMFAPRILYRDGRAVDPPDRGPDDRGRWTGGGRSITVQWENGHTSRYTNIGTGAYFYARPAAPGQRLDGTFRTTSGTTLQGADGPTTAFSAQAITFRPDGTFSLASSAGSLGPNVAVAGANRQAAGRYALDGWTITFTYADGRTARGLFYRYPNADDTVGIGTAGGVSTYIKDDK